MCAVILAAEAEAMAEPEDDDEEGEEAVVDRWTPRFAYGR